MIDSSNLLAVEQASVRGWPARDTEMIDGWLARASSGTSVRGNSVAALAWTGHDLGAAISRVVSFYRDRGAAPLFTISDASVPAGLDDALERAGWRRGIDHVTMAKSVRRKPIRAGLWSKPMNPMPPGTMSTWRA